MSLPVLFLQYSRRATMLARTILAGSLVLIVLAPSLPYAAKWVIENVAFPGRVEPPVVRIIWNPAGGRVPLTDDRATIDDLGRRFELSKRPPQIHLEIQKPIAYIQRPFDFKGVRLSGYALESPSRR
jgi:hypothetical protein